MKHRQRWVFACALLVLLPTVAISQTTPFVPLEPLGQVLKTSGIKGTPVLTPSPNKLGIAFDWAKSSGSVSGSLNGLGPDPVPTSAVTPSAVNTPVDLGFSQLELKGWGSLLPKMLDYPDCKPFLMRCHITNLPLVGGVASLRFELEIRGAFSDESVTLAITFRWQVTPVQGCTAPTIQSDGKEFAAPRLATACEDRITIKNYLPDAATSPIAAMADRLPGFCAYGTYSLQDKHKDGANIQLVLRNENNQLIAISKQFRAFQPGKDESWGGNCAAPSWIFIEEVAYSTLSPLGLWPYRHEDLDGRAAGEVLGKLRMFAVLVDAVTSVPIVFSDPITYDIVPGGRLISVNYKLSGPGAEFIPPGDIILTNYQREASGKPLVTEIAQTFAYSAGQPSSKFKKLELEAEVVLPANVATFSAEIHALNHRLADIPSQLTAFSAPLESGRQKVKVDVKGNLPPDAWIIAVDPVIELTTGQRIFLPEHQIRVNSITILSVEPQNGKCSFLELDKCFRLGEPNPVRVRLAVALSSSAKRAISQRTAYYQLSGGPQQDASEGPTTLDQIKLSANQAAEYSDNFTTDLLVRDPKDPQIGLARDTASFSMVYHLQECGNLPFCAIAAKEYTDFATPLMELGGSAVSTMDTLNWGAVTGVKKLAPFVFRGIRKAAGDIAFAQFEKRNGLKSQTLPASADTPPQEIHLLRDTWQFSPTLPRDGSFSGDLSLRYSPDQFEADPDFAVSKLQIVSVDTAGALHVYPSTVDTTKQEVTAHIDSLDPSYALAIVGPFRFTPVMLPSAASGFSVVNAGGGTAELKLSTQTSDGTVSTPGLTSLPALNMFRSGGADWVRAWADSTSVVGASWQESGALLAVTPAGKPDNKFLLPGLEYKARRNVELHWANPSVLETEVTFALYNSDGTQAGTHVAALAGGASAIARLKAMFPALADSFNGYAIVSATRPIVLNALVKTSTSTTSLAAQGINSEALAVTTRFAPVVVTASGSSALHLVNLGTNSAQVILRARNANGSAVGDLQVPVPAGRQQSRTLAELFGDAAVASVTLTSNVPGILGDLVSVDPAFQARYEVSLPFTGQSAANAVLPYATSSTVVPVFNPGTVAASVTVTPYSASGVAGTAVNSSVSAGARTLINVQSSGYVIVRSSQPIIAVGLVTSVTGGTAGYPAIGVAATGTIPGGGSGPTPFASAAGVRNGASLIAGPVAPGEILRISGSNIGPASKASLKVEASGKVATLLGDARVLFDDVPGAMIYSLSGENSVVVPYSVSGKTTTKIVLEYQGRRSDPITLTVAPSAPGLLSSDGSGAGQGAILNYAVSGTTVNSPQNPIDKGGIITLYGTGEGVVSPPNQDGDVVAGLHKPVLGDAKVTIGGIDAKVLFTGSAPGMVAGVLQINVEVPINAPSGNQPVLVTIGNVTSPAGITVAIKGTSTTPAPAITVDPTTLDFGTVSVNQSKDLTLTIRNTGTATLTVSSMASSNARFTLTAGLTSFSVGAGSFQTIPVRFTPTAGGGQNGVLTLITNDPARPAVNVNLAGTGATASAAPNISLDPTSLNFGSVPVGQTKDLVLAVRNIGTAALTIITIGGTSDRFTPVGITVPITIGAGSSQNLTFRFTPIASGVQTGNLIITSNDPTRPSLTVSVTGGVPAITFGQSINGTLTTSAGRSVDCSNCYAESYILTVTEQRPYTFTLTSTAFNAYFNVLDLSGKILAWDDDSGGGTNARLSGIVVPGTYIIEVTSSLTNQTGAYTFSIAP